MRIRRAVGHIILSLFFTCLTLAAMAEPRGVCQGHKGSEIKCTIGGERQGFLIDIHPLRRHVRASITTFWTRCGFSRKADFHDTYYFSSNEPRTVWYRYNKAFWPVHGAFLSFADCIETYIHDCAEIRDDGTSSDGACGDLLIANGFTYQQRPD